MSHFNYATEHLSLPFPGNQVHGHGGRLGIHHWIEHQVSQNPGAIAVIGADEILTYAELNRRANQLARYLQRLGVQSETVVAVYLERSPALIVALLAVLKAGGAYLPLDPIYPHERRLYKLQDSQAPIIITQSSLESTLPTEGTAQVVRYDTDAPRIAIEEWANLNTPISPDQLAYVMYTSGSTGQPKGVMVLHRGVVNHGLAMAQEFALQPCDRMLQFSSMSFDIMVEELYPTLFSGATLVLRPESISHSTQAFLEFVDQHHISILDLPTAFWHELVYGVANFGLSWPKSVRLIIVGGEKASKSLYQQWRQQVPSTVRWLNTYGPTETTVTATLYDPIADHSPLESAEIPIGRPIAHTYVYVLDPQLQPVDIGQPGELYIGGAGVGRGYLNRPEATQQKFIVHPWLPGESLYATGDMVRQGADGNLEFIGRQDFQVKIRGYRIELGEIEQVLETHPMIQQAVVLAPEITTGQRRLEAYLIASVALPIQELRAFLRAKLPDYMVPARLTCLPSFPLTPNGKVDRRALMEVNLAFSQSSLGSAPQEGPQDAIEGQLLRLWQEILMVPHLSPTDNFFDLGGHSLMILRLFGQIAQEMGQTLPVTAIFQAPTTRQLANLLRQDRSQCPLAQIVPFRKTGHRAPVFCIPGAWGNLSYVHGLTRHLAGDFPIYGLQEATPPQSPFPLQLQEVAQQYVQTLRTIQPQGPYCLVGYSFGGLIAYEMAQQLQAQKQSISLLALLDPSPPITLNALRRWVLPLANGQPWDKKSEARPRQLLSLVWLSLVHDLQLNHLRLSKLPWSARLPYVLQMTANIWTQSARQQSTVFAQKDAGSNRASGSDGIWNSRDSVVGLQPLPIMKYDRVIKHYLPTSYSQPIHFLTSQEWEADAANPGIWKQLSTGGGRYWTFPGTHISLYQEPTIAKVAEILNTLL
jgi:amino acid adenylation domain-containing protein